MEPNSCRRLKCLNSLRFCILHCVCWYNKAFAVLFLMKLHIKCTVDQPANLFFRPQVFKKFFWGRTPWSMTSRCETQHGYVQILFIFPKKKKSLCGFNYNIKLSSGRAHSMSSDPMGSLAWPYYHMLLFSIKNEAACKPTAGSCPWSLLTHNCTRPQSCLIC